MLEFSLEEWASQEPRCRAFWAAPSSCHLLFATDHTFSPGELHFLLGPLLTVFYLQICPVFSSCQSQFAQLHYGFCSYIATFNYYSFIFRFSSPILFSFFSLVLPMLVMWQVVIVIALPLGSEVKMQNCNSLLLFHFLSFYLLDNTSFYNYPGQWLFLSCQIQVH